MNFNLTHDEIPPPLQGDQGEANPETRQSFCLRTGCLSTQRRTQPPKFTYQEVKTGLQGGVRNPLACKAWDSPLTSYLLGLGPEKVRRTASVIRCEETLEVDTVQVMYQTRVSNG